MAAKSIEKHLGLRIAAQRRHRKLTQAELAEIADVTPETISRLERGAAMPSLTRLSEIANALGVELRDLFPSAGSLAKESALEKLATVTQDLTPVQLETLARVAEALFTSAEVSPRQRRRRQGRS